MNEKLTITLAAAVALAAGLDAATLLETEAFAEKGGWVVDQQFMDQMGSPFLLAHGLGKPVADAVTKVTLAKGEYRVWVRTRDWVAPQGPGRFKVVVPGRFESKELGVGEGTWRWEDAGVFECALLALQGLNASLRVDDGTARLTTLVAGYTYEYGGKGQDAVVTIAGANPSLKASNSLEFYAGSKLVFELPEAGYEEGCIPVDVGKVGGWGSGCKLEFVGAAAMQARHLQDEIDARYVLVRAPSGAAFIPDAAIAEAQAALGDGFRLYKTVSDGYQMLMLRVRLNKGLTVILN